MFYSAGATIAGQCSITSSQSIASSHVVEREGKVLPRKMWVKQAYQISLDKPRHLNYHLKHGGEQEIPVKTRARFLCVSS